jgi:MFS family permease
VEPAGERRDGYAWYALGVLTLVYVFNFLDRQILAILAEDIKADLALSDGQIGFLYGTAFAVFYAVFGIPLGRLADVWTRRTVISIGLASWSLMTAVSGFARTFAQLGAARIGVGIGEASASPAAFSLLSDYFPPERRATVMAVYSSGLYVGAGIGLFIGGVVVDAWNAAWPEGGAPLGLAGWQAAFLVVGTPGLLMALWVRTLREPVRGGLGAGAAGVASAELRPAAVFLRELATVVPPLTVVSLWRAGAGPGGVAANAAIAVGLFALAACVTAWIGDPVQWYALAAGLYATASWLQNLALGDRATFDVMVRTRTFRTSLVGFSLLAFGSYSVGFWTVPYFLRAFELRAAEAGTALGLFAAVGGWLGATLGGVAADAWRRRAHGGRLYFCIVAAVLPMPFVITLVRTDSLALAYAMAFFAQVANGAWLGAAISTVQDLVPARMRAVAGAVYLLMLTFVGLALGPYTVGRLSEATGSLGGAIETALLANAAAIAMFAAALRTLAQDEMRAGGHE